MQPQRNPQHPQRGGRDHGELYAGWPRECVRRRGIRQHQREEIEQQEDDDPGQPAECGAAGQHEEYPYCIPRLADLEQRLVEPLAALALERLPLRRLHRAVFATWHPRFSNVGKKNGTAKLQDYRDCELRVVDA